MYSSDVGVHLRSEVDQEAAQNVLDTDSTFSLSCTSSSGEGVSTNLGTLEDKTSSLNIEALKLSEILDLLWSS